MFPRKKIRFPYSKCSDFNDAWKVNDHRFLNFIYYIIYKLCIKSTQKAQVISFLISDVPKKFALIYSIGPSRTYFPIVSYNRVPCIRNLLCLIFHEGISIECGNTVVNRGAWRYRVLIDHIQHRMRRQLFFFRTWPVSPNSAHPIPGGFTLRSGLWREIDRYMNR